MLIIYKEYKMEKIDKRIIRTRRDIQNAFLTLLETKHYKSITIQDILDKAQINRTTFYKHYENKHELALQIMNDFKREFIFPVAQQRFQFTAREFLERVSPMMNKHRPLIKLLIKIDTAEINFLRDIQLLAKEKYIESFKEVEGYTEEDLDLQGYLYASLTAAMLRYCLEHDKEISFALHENVVAVFKRGIL